MKKFLYYWFPAIVYAGLIFYLSSLPTIPSPLLEITKETFILHMIEYAIFSVLLFRAFVNSDRTILRKNAIFLTILIASIYGVTDETHQLFVPGRFFSYFDMLADGLGSCIVLLGNNFFIRLENRIKKILSIF